MSGEIERMVTELRSGCEQNLRITVERIAEVEQEISDTRAMQAKQKEYLREVCIRIASGAQLEESVIEDRAIYEDRVLQYALIIAKYEDLLSDQIEFEEDLRGQLRTITRVEESASSLSHEEREEFRQTLAEDGW